MAAFATSTAPMEEVMVERSEQFATYRQTIRPHTQEEVMRILSLLYPTLRTDKFTGSVTIHMVMGGVRTIVTDQIARIPAKSEADIVLERNFRK